MKNKTKTRLKALAMAIVMILASVGVSTSLETEAAEKYGYTILKTIQYNGTPVNLFQIDGREAFCIQHESETPIPDAAAFDRTIYENDMIKKCLYYGYGGEGQWSGFANNDYAIWCTTLALSYCYQLSGGTMADIKFDPLVSTAPEGSGELSRFLSEIVLNSGVSVPGTYGYFTSASGIATDVIESGTTTKKLTLSMERDTAAGNQHTNWITYKRFEQVNGEVIPASLNLPDGISLVKGDSSHNPTGTYTGTVTINENESFYLTGSLLLGKGSFNSGTLGTGYAYQSILYVADGGYQNLIAKGKTKDPTHFAELEVNWNTDTTFDKVDDNNRPLKGATLWLFKAHGYTKTETAADLIDSWTTDGTTHTIEGLVPGQLYRLYEAKAPVGYTKADDIYFTVDANTGKSSVTMQDIITKTKVDKIDENGTPVSGAEFWLFKANGYNKNETAADLVDSWTTDGTTHTIKGLEIGRLYRLYEAKAPAGYARAADKYFTVEADGTTDVVIVDTKLKTEIEKIDDEGNVVKGAVLATYDSTGKEIERWTTGKDKYNLTASLYVENATYTLKEIQVPDGYKKAPDQTFVFSSTQNTVTMVDAKYKTEFAKVDENGKGIIGATIEVTDKADGKVVDTWITDGSTHTIKGLTLNKTYVMTETVVPNGYIKSEPVEFTFTADNQTVTMTDLITKTEVSKVDENGNNLIGAKLQILDGTTVVDEWVSNGLTHTITGLTAGKKYTLHEVSAPNGYKLAADKTFTVSTTEVTNVLEMVDAKTETETIFSKTDKNGENLVGAKVQVTDKDGNVIDTWTTTNETHIIKGLVIGATYTYTELEAPEGYAVAAPVTFTVTGTGQIIKMVDTKIVVIDSPHTGDSFPVLPVAGTGVLALALIGAIVIFKKKKEQ